MELFKQILEISAALLTPLIGVIGAVVLINQYRLQRFRWRLALYDKRYPVYLATKEFLIGIMARHNVSNDELYNFLRNSKDKEFLFGKDVKEYLEQLYLKGLDLQTVEKEVDQHPVGDERTNLVHQSSVIFKWFRGQYESVDKVFGEYLTVAKK